MLSSVQHLAVKDLRQAPYFCAVAFQPLFFYSSGRRVDSDSSRSAFQIAHKCRSRYEPLNKFLLVRSSELDTATRFPLSPFKV